MATTRPAIHLSEEVRWTLIVILMALLALTFAAQSTGTSPTSPPMPDQTAGEIHIVSPRTGVFLAGEYEGAVPFVHVGSHVTPSTVVGMVAPMDAGLMPVMAGVHGTVIEILVGDGELVAPGHPLMRIELVRPDVREPR